MINFRTRDSVGVHEEVSANPMMMMFGGSNPIPNFPSGGLENFGEVINSLFEPPFVNPSVSYHDNVCLIGFSKRSYLQ